LITLNFISRIAKKWDSIRSDTLYAPIQINFIAFLFFSILKRSSLHYNIFSYTDYSRMFKEIPGCFFNYFRIFIFFLRTLSSFKFLSFMKSCNSRVSTLSLGSWCQLVNCWSSYVWPTKWNVLFELNQRICILILMRKSYCKSLIPLIRILNSWNSFIICRRAVS
jgi:hypothetical protein